MLRSSSKLLPFALSAAALICLVVVFEGCRSTSSPQDLFFLKVNNYFTPLHTWSLTDIVFQVDWRSLKQRRIVRSFSLSDQASNLADSAQDGLNQASDSLSHLRNKLQSTLPDYYAFGLWGYCAGDENAPTYTTCSTPTMSFSFDMVAILESNIPGSVTLLPEASKIILSGLSNLSKWAIAAYIIGMAATALTVIAELLSILLKRGPVPALICSLVRQLVRDERAKD